jgi:hypothetical protein
MERPEPIREYTITPHAIFEMQRRELDEELIRRVLEGPEQRRLIRPGRDVLPSRLDVGDREFLVRVFVDVDRVPAEVATAYRTSKIDKYWGTET